MFPIFSAPDTPLYEQKWPTSLPASFFDDLAQHPQAVRDYKKTSDGAYGRIPLERRVNELSDADVGDKVFPHFIGAKLPAGVTGLLIAAIFAAAMSSLDSAICASFPLNVRGHPPRFLVQCMLFPGVSDFRAVECDVMRLRS